MVFTRLSNAFVILCMPSTCPTTESRMYLMVKKIKKVAKALKKASALHKKQSKVIENHIKEMKSYGKKKRS